MLNQMKMPLISMQIIPQILKKSSLFQSRTHFSNLVILKNLMISSQDVQSPRFSVHHCPQQLQPLLNRQEHQGLPLILHPPQLHHLVSWSQLESALLKIKQSEENFGNVNFATKLITLKTHLIKFTIPMDIRRKFEHSKPTIF